MDITVVGRNAEISSRLRDYVEEKAAKVEQLDPRVQRVEVEVTHERNPRQADTAERAAFALLSCFMAYSTTLWRNFISSVILISEIERLKAKEVIIIGKEGTDISVPSTPKSVPAVFQALRFEA